MSLSSYNRLRQYLGTVVVGGKEEHVNAASIDLVLGNKIMIERVPDTVDNYTLPVIEMDSKNSDHLISKTMDEKGHLVPPGGVVLAQTVELFNLPDWISSEYKLKSTQARNFFNHLNAGWCDAGWNGSVLTLEFVNHNQYHWVRIKPGMKCGQMVFFEHEEVPAEASYRNRGQYNGDKEVTPGKGLK